MEPISRCAWPSGGRRTPADLKQACAASVAATRTRCTSSTTQALITLRVHPFVYWLRPLGGWRAAVLAGAPSCSRIVTRSIRVATDCASELSVPQRRHRSRRQNGGMDRLSSEWTKGDQGLSILRSLVRCPETFTGSSRAQTTPRGVAALAKTPGMSFGRRLARRRLDPAITPATFLDTALADRIPAERLPRPGGVGSCSGGEGFVSAVMAW